MMGERLTRCGTSVGGLGGHVFMFSRRIDRGRRRLIRVGSQIEDLGKDCNLTGGRFSVAGPLTSRNIIPQVRLLGLRQRIGSAGHRLASARLGVPMLDSTVRRAILGQVSTTLGFQSRRRRGLGDVRSGLSTLARSRINLGSGIGQAVMLSPMAKAVGGVCVGAINNIVRPNVSLVRVIPARSALLVRTGVTPRSVTFLHPKLTTVIGFDTCSFAHCNNLGKALRRVDTSAVRSRRKGDFCLIQIEASRSSLSRRGRFCVVPKVAASMSVVVKGHDVLSCLLGPVLRMGDSTLGRWCK